MDLLLLSAGAIVLIGITLWIVWPARTADPVGAVHGEEVSAHRMSEPVRAGLAPQGDRFADQYTSATADLSAGGVAAAIEGIQAGAATTRLAQRESYLTPVRPTVTAPTLARPETRSLSSGRSLGVGGGALLALGGGVGGAWLYARWQRRRNKPINRLRRNARQMASRLGERLPDVDELPYGAAPMGGAATALLLSALVATRAVRRDADDSPQHVRDRAADLLTGAAHEALERSSKQARELRSRIHEDATLEQARKPAVMGIGLGGIGLVAGGAFVIWRLLRRGQPDRSGWYAGE